MQKALGLIVLLALGGLAAALVARGCAPAPSRASDAGVAVLAVDAGATPDPQAALAAAAPPAPPPADEVVLDEPEPELLPLLPLVPPPPRGATPANGKGRATPRAPAKPPAERTVAAAPAAAPAAVPVAAPAAVPVAAPAEDPAAAVTTASVVTPPAPVAADPPDAGPAAAVVDTRQPTPLRVALRDDLPWLKPVEIAVDVDGAEVFRTNLAAGFVAAEATTVFDGALGPGRHRVRIRTVWVGDGGGVFSYLQGYRVKMAREANIQGAAGPVTVVVTGVERGDATSDITARAGLALAIDRD